MKAILAIALALSLGAPAYAQQHKPTKVETRLLTLLQVKSEAIPSFGLRLVDHVTMGALASGENQDIWVAVNPKKTYVAIGVCDEDACGNIDISTFDADGNAMDKDLGPDASAVVFIEKGVLTPKVKLFVSVSKCSVAPCTYAVGLYEMRGG